MPNPFAEVFFSIPAFVIGTIILLAGIALWKVSGLDPFFRSACRTCLSVGCLVVVPLTANHLYPYHVMNQTTDCFHGAIEWGYVPKGVLHHPTPAEVSAMLHGPATEWTVCTSGLDCPSPAPDQPAQR